MLLVPVEVRVHARSPARSATSSLRTARHSTLGRDHSKAVRCHIKAMATCRTLTAAVHQEEDWYIAQCFEVDVASQGRTIDEALGNLAEAVALYLDEVDDPQRHVTATPLVTSFQVPGAA